MYLVSAYFDSRSSKKLNRLISCMAEKCGNDFMTAHNVPPHLTLCQIEAKNEEVLLSPFQSLHDTLQNTQTENMQIFFASAGFFPPSVIYTAPVYNEVLDFLVKTVYCTFCNIGQTKISRFYKPMSFLPHVTLGKTLTKEQMKIAFAFLQDNFVPFKAQITKLELSKVKPYTDLADIQITSGTSACC